MRTAARIALFSLLLGAIINIGVAWSIAGAEGDGEAWDEGHTIQYLARGGTYPGINLGIDPGVDPDADILVTAYVRTRPGAMRVIVNTWQVDDARGRKMPLTSGLAAPTWISPGKPASLARVRWDDVQFVDGFGFPMPSMSCLWMMDGSVALGVPLTATSVPAPQAAPVIMMGTTEYDIGPEDVAWVMPAGMPPPPVAAPAQLVSRALPLQPVWPGFAINTLCYAAIAWLLLIVPLVVRRRIRKRRGLCPKCAYDLRATPGERCPECGAAVTPAPALNQ